MFSQRFVIKGGAKEISSESYCRWGLGFSQKQPHIFARTLNPNVQEIGSKICFFVPYTEFIPNVFSVGFNGFSRQV